MTGRSVFGSFLTLVFTGAISCSFLPALAENPKITETYKVTGSLMRSPINVDAQPGDTFGESNSYSCDESVFNDSRANSLLDSADYDELVRKCNTVLGDDQTSAWARFYRGCAYYHQDEFRLAIRDFKQTSSDVFYGRTSHIWLGSCYERVRKYQSAIAHYSEAIKAGDNDPGLLVSRGCIVGLTGKWQEAIEDFNTAIELQPESGWALFNRGYAHAKLNNFEEALQDLTASIELDPALSNAYNYRGYIYEQRKDLDSAIADLSKAIELNSDYAAAYMNRGCAYYLKNECEKADKDFRKARELDSHLREHRPVL